MKLLDKYRFLVSNVNQTLTFSKLYIKENSLMDSVGEGEGGKIWENGIETCKYHV